MIDWFRLALRKDILARGLKIGAVVGTLLTAINYGDVLIAGEVLPLMYWKILMTYCVPFCVSTYASVEAARATR
jgi:hypothetical protein